jgi:PadR family transcriptional regulator PadR
MSDLVFLRDPSFLILAALAQEDLHGYGIMKEVERLSEGRVRLALGTLYGVLDRLVAKGVVEVAREERQGGRLRRYYHLTEPGADDLREETEVQAQLVEVARRNLELRKPSAAKPLEAL